MSPSSDPSQSDGSSTESPRNVDDSQPWISIVALGAGVLGGLLLVISVIVVCKCFKKSNEKQPETTRVPSERKTFRPYREYESLNYVSASFDEDKFPPSLEPRNGYSPKQDGRPGETEEKRNLVDEDNNFEYSARFHELRDIPEEVPMNFSADSDAEMNSNESEQGEASGSRYTEGDYHHLKKLRIDQSPPLFKMVRQTTVATPEIMAYEHYPRTYTDDQSMFPEDNTGAFHTSVDVTAPMLPIKEVSSPMTKPKKTEVSVEIHQEYSGNSTNSRQKATPPGELPVAVEFALVGSNYRAKRKQSQSLEVVSPCERYSLADARKVRSYDAVLDYEEETRGGSNTTDKGPFYNTDYTVVREHQSPYRSASKVSYNDTGSYEDICQSQIRNELDTTEIEVDGITLTESDDTETLNGAQKYRDLWHLRTTLEEDDENLSDVIRVEDMTSPENESHGSEPDMCTTSQTTSFESNTEAGYVDESDHHHHHHHHQSEHCEYQNERSRRPSAHLLCPPTYEIRRQNYKSILTKRLQDRVPPVPGQPIPVSSQDNSFDSFESGQSGGGTSESSRHEVTTTSFETSTDNTDSTNDSQTHKLQQMKHDSGYRSLEANKSLDSNNRSLETQSPPKPSKKQMRVSFDQDSIEKDEPPTDKPSPSRHVPNKRSKKNNTPSHYFDRRNGKTASKKRRDFHRERQMVQVYESINEPETDSRSDQPSGDSFDEPTTMSAPSKFNVFSRFFHRSNSGKGRGRPRMRDYSVDEKTDQLFNEFARIDPKYEGNLQYTIRSRSPRMHPRYRLHRKQSEPSIAKEGRRNKLTPGMRSASMGSDSSASSRKLSPQDSIEEEYLRIESGKTWEGISRPDVMEQPKSHHQPSTIHEIPIIKLPTEDHDAEMETG